MKYIIIVFAFLTFNNLAIGQELVLDGAVLEQAIETAITTAKQLAIQEAEQKLSEEQRKALSTVSQFIKLSGGLNNFKKGRIKFLEEARETLKEIANIKNNPSLKQKGYKDVKKLQEENESLNTQIDSLTEDDDSEGTDFDRLNMIKVLEAEQKENTAKIYAKKAMYRDYNNYMNALNSTIK